MLCVACVERSIEARRALLKAKTAIMKRINPATFALAIRAHELYRRCFRDKGMLRDWESHVGRVKRCPKKGLPDVLVHLGFSQHPEVLRLIALGAVKIKIKAAATIVYHCDLGTQYNKQTRAARTLQQPKYRDNPDDAQKVRRHIANQESDQDKRAAMLRVLMLEDEGHLYSVRGVLQPTRLLRDALVPSVAAPEPRDAALQNFATPDPETEPGFEVMDVQPENPHIVCAQQLPRLQCSCRRESCFCEVALSLTCVGRDLLVGFFLVLMHVGRDRPWRGGRGQQTRSVGTFAGHAAVRAQHLCEESSAWLLTPDVLSHMSLQMSLRKPVPVLVKDGAALLLVANGWACQFLTTNDEKGAVVPLDLNFRVSDDKNICVWRGGLPKNYLRCLAYVEAGLELKHRPEELKHFAPLSYYSQLLGLDSKRNRRQAQAALQDAGGVPANLFQVPQIEPSVADEFEPALLEPRAPALQRAASHDEAVSGDEMVDELMGLLDSDQDESCASESVRAAPAPRSKDRVSWVAYRAPLYLLSPAFFPLVLCSI